MSLDDGLYQHRIRIRLGRVRGNDQAFLFSQAAQFGRHRELQWRVNVS